MSLAAPGVLARCMLTAEGVGSIFSDLIIFVQALYFVLGSLHASVYEISEQLFFHAYHMKKDCLGGVFVYELSGYF